MINSYQGVRADRLFLNRVAQPRQSPATHRIMRPKTSLPTRGCVAFGRATLTSWSARPRGKSQGMGATDGQCYCGQSDRDTATQGMPSEKNKTACWESRAGDPNLDVCPFQKHWFGLAAAIRVTLPTSSSPLSSFWITYGWACAERGRAVP